MQTAGALDKSQRTLGVFCDLYKLLESYAMEVILTIGRKQRLKEDKTFISG